MTIQCKQVIDACDFKIADAKTIEEYLTKVTPSQLIAFVWQRDKKVNMMQNGLDLLLLMDI